MLETSQITPKEIAQKIARISLVTGIAAAGSMAIDLMRPMSADAAGPVCQGQEGTFIVYGKQVNSLDLEGGKKGILEPGEPWIERQELGGQLVVRTADGRRLTGSFFEDAPSIPGVTIPDRNLKVGWALVKYMSKCTTDMTLANGTVVPAQEVEITNSQDEGNHTFRHNIAMNMATPVWLTRTARDENAFFSLADQNPTLVHNAEALAKVRKSREEDAAQKQMREEIQMALLKEREQLDADGRLKWLGVAGVAALGGLGLVALASRRRRSRANQQHNEGQN